MYKKGRGAQIHLPNKYERNYIEKTQGQNEEDPDIKVKTRVYFDTPQKIISVNESPDIPFKYSINPYQGCEHGCVYCYARNSHEYWGFNAGLDFESRIICKPDAPELLRKTFLSSVWKPALIVLSGNTDCYQPLERRMKITRELLKVFLRFGNPVSIITKNVLILRDSDILVELAKENLIKVIFSITTLDDDLRQKLEPRSASAARKLKTINKLSENNIPVSVMLGPLIPGINNHEIPSIIKASSEAGAYDINMVLIRLNGSIGIIFRDWLNRNFPDREEKVWNQIKALHKGNVNESRWGYRMKGEGNLADSLHNLFRTIKNRYFKNTQNHELSLERFRRDGTGWLF